MAATIAADLAVPMTVLGQQGLSSTFGASGFGVYQYDFGGVSNPNTHIVVIIFADVLTIATAVEYVGKVSV